MVMAFFLPAVGKRGDEGGVRSEEERVGMLWGHGNVVERGECCCVSNSLVRCACWALKEVGLVVNVH